MIDLKVKIDKREFSNPVFVASGTFGYGVDVPDLVDISQLGAIVTKSITLFPREGNPPPRIVETSAGMINSIGLANIGVDRYIDKMIPRYRELQLPIIMNIAGSTIDEYMQVMNKVESVSSNIAGYEINISCPNVKAGGMQFGVSSDITAQLTATLRKLTERLLIMKLSPNVTDITAIGRAAQNSGADAVSAINTVVGMSVNPDTFKSNIHTVYGGLSGPAIKPIGLACVHKLRQKLSIPIIGIGGITSARDVIEYALAGASAVQVGTANFRNPSIGLEIIGELKQYLKQKNITSFKSIVGKIEPCP